jgi:hypothetical protein
MNDAVPGGVVLQFIGNRYYVLQTQLTDMTRIHSVGALRLDVQSLSNGPYKQKQAEDAR